MESCVYICIPGSIITKYEVLNNLEMQYSSSSKTETLFEIRYITALHFSY